MPAQLPKISRTGITPLFGGLDSHIDVVFVHGLNGQPAHTWLFPGTGFFWPLQLNPYLDNARVMLFGYDADVGPSLNENRTRVLGIAKKLLSSLANHRRSAPERDRPLIFVGHSLGGLVIKAALIEAHKVLESKIDGWDRIYNSTGGIMLFGVPNAGSSASQKKRVRLLQKAGAINIPPLLEEALRLHSPDTMDLATDFRRLSLCTRELLYVYSYFEERTTVGLGEVVVDEMSATIAYNREVLVPMPSDHESMVKFRDFEDSNFTNVVGQLLYIVGELLDRAAQSQSQGTQGQAQSHQVYYGGQAQSNQVSHSQAHSYATGPPMPPRPAQQYYGSNPGPTNQGQFMLPPMDPAEQAARNNELIAAAGAGDLAKVRALHKAGADPSYSSGPAWQPSALAAAITTYSNNYSTATNGWYSSGAMASIGNVMLGTAKKCAEVMKYLLDNGADWNSLTPQQQSSARTALTQ